MQRVSAFIVVGVFGFIVQIAVLTWLTSVGHVPYALATVAAVEAAVLHNFLWHERWTWADRGRPSGWPGRLMRFHAGAGLTSIAGNVIVTVAGVELLALPPALANAVAVMVTSVANYSLADRWVFVRGKAALALALLLAAPALATAAPEPDTLAAWNRHVARTEAQLPQHERDAPIHEPEGRTIQVPGGTIHEWRGSLLVHGITVPALVRALSDPGLPPPSDDVLDARVLRRGEDSLSVYLKLTRSAIVTVTYDSEHDVMFARHSPGFATSRSVSTRIRETDGGDRGFLWRLNSYWRYRQVGAAVQVDVLSLSLSRDVPMLARPIAGPIINRVARESMRRTLEAMQRFAVALHGSVAERPAPMGRSAGLQDPRALTSTPDADSPALSHAASAGAPAVSPCTQMVSTSTRRTVPSVDTTVRSVAIRMARVTTSSMLTMTAPGRCRGASDPSGRYARSANPSSATRRPAARPASASAEAGGAHRTSDGANAATARATASAVGRSAAAML